jgi:hypothetical protein
VTFGNLKQDCKSEKKLKEFPLLLQETEDGRQRKTKMKKGECST